MRDQVYKAMRGGNFKDLFSDLILSVSTRGYGHFCGLCTIGHLVDDNTLIVY